MSFLRRLLGHDDRDAMDVWTERPPAPPQVGDLVLLDAGPRKIEVIKVVREGTGLGLKEAKDLVDRVPSVVNGVSAEALRRAGATVEHHGGVAPPASAPVAGDGSVFLEDAGPKKIHVIKVVREASGLGLKAAKDLVEAAPTLLVSGLSPEAAADLRRELERAGARVR